MKKEEKGIIISQIKETISQYDHFYLTETQGLTAEQVTELRRACYKADVKMVVVKNKLMKKALESFDQDFSPLFDSLKENTTVLFCNTGNQPAKVMKEFLKKNEKPVLKSAFVEQSFYVGADQLDTLSNIKSKNELIGDVIALLQSPAKNVISALQTGGSTIHGVLQTLSER